MMADIPRAVLWLTLAPAVCCFVSAGGCLPKEPEVFSASASLRLTQVTRQSDGSILYDGCAVITGTSTLPTFAAHTGDVLSEHVKLQNVDKRTETYNPSLNDFNDRAYWCGSKDNFGNGDPGAIGRADCYRAAGADPPAMVVSASLEYDTSMTVAVGVTRVLQVRHAGTLTLEPNPPCPGPGLPPPTVDELTITE